MRQMHEIMTRITDTIVIVATGLGEIKTIRSVQPVYPNEEGSDIPEETSERQNKDFEKLPPGFGDQIATHSLAMDLAQAEGELEEKGRTRVKAGALVDPANPTRRLTEKDLLKIGELISTLGNEIAGYQTDAYWGSQRV